MNISHWFLIFCRLQNSFASLLFIMRNKNVSTNIIKLLKSTCKHTHTNIYPHTQSHIVHIKKNIFGNFKAAGKSYSQKICYTQQSDSTAKPLYLKTVFMRWNFMFVQLVMDDGVVWFVGWSEPTHLCIALICSHAPVSIRPVAICFASENGDYQNDMLSPHIYSYLFEQIKEIIWSEWVLNCRGKLKVALTFSDSSRAIMEMCTIFYRLLTSHLPNSSSSDLKPPKNTQSHHTQRRHPRSMHFSVAQSNANSRRERERGGRESVWEKWDQNAH